MIHDLLHHVQHGFTAGQSKMISIQCFDAAVASIISRNYAYDIISVDFKKAFDKTQHHHVLRALSSLGICGAAYDWFVSFLSKCTQQVRVRNKLISLLLHLIGHCPMQLP